MEKTAEAALMAGVGKSDITRWEAGEIMGDMAMKAGLGLDRGAGIKVHDFPFQESVNRNCALATW